MGTTDRRAYLAALCRTVPYHIVEHVLDNPVAESCGDQEFEGTLLYADLVGFTSLCDDLAEAGIDSLSRLSALLTEFFGTMLEQGIFPYDGYVLQFGGDSASVAFRGEGHALRGAACAQKLCEVAQNVPIARGSDGLRLRVGMTTGVIGLLVVGDDTQRAVLCESKIGSRALSLQDRAEPGTVFLDTPAAEALGDDAELTLRDEGVYQLQSLHQTPPTVIVRELGDRIDSQTEQKISLLAPFVPPPMAARLRAVPDNWHFEPELRDVVVVFSEIRRISEDAAASISEFSRKFLRIYRRYGGIIMKVNLAPEGHRVMAVFGLHAPTDNDGERAVMAALDATSLMSSLANMTSDDFEIRTGVHRGVVYFGAIGSVYRHDITIIGDSVNVAARAASQAAPFQVVITAPIADELDSTFGTSPLRPVHVKGKQDALVLQAVRETTASHARYMQTRRQQRRLPGRETEVLQLSDLVSEALDGRGGFVGVSGEHGSGKSALLSPIINQWTTGGGVAMLGRCRYSTRLKPFAPIAAMFRNFLGLNAEERPSHAMARIREVLKEYDLGDDGDTLMEFLAENNTERLHPKRPDHDRWHAVERAVCQFVSRRIETTPVLYVLEDLHNADSLTLRTVRHLIAKLPAGRFMMIATYRETPELEALRKEFGFELRLGRLSLRDSGELAALRSGADAVDADSLTFIWERTEGNPGRICDLIGFMRDRSLLEVRSGILTPSAIGVERMADVVPRTMSQFALVRLESLGEVERHLLRIASAIGRTFDRAILDTAITGLDRDAVGNSIAILLDEGVITPEIAPGAVYRFRDELVRTVTYSTIPKAERCQYHHRIAECLESIEQFNVPRNAAILAYHRQVANDLAEAATHYETAIQFTFENELDREVIVLAHQWRELTSRLTGSTISKQRRARVAVAAYIATSRSLGAKKAEHQESGEVLNLWDSVSTEERTVFELWKGVNMLSLGDAELGRQFLTGAYEASDAPHIRARAALKLAYSYSFVDDKLENEWLTKCAQDVSDPESPLGLRLELGRACILASSGNLDEARLANARARDHAKRNDCLAIAAIAACNLADCDLQAGDVEQALKGFEEARWMSRVLGSVSDDAIDNLNFGLCHLYADRAQQALPFLEQSLGLAKTAGDTGVEIEAQIALGAAIGLTTNVVEGKAMCDLGRRRAVSRSTSTVELEALLHLLRLDMIEGDLEAATLRLAECQRLITNNKATPLLTRNFERLRARLRSLTTAATTSPGTRPPRRPR